eukprot:12936952-Alexandrium_andersonii.AAC.1
MANPKVPGGGATKGRGAQEENLHRRTDAFRFLAEQAEQEEEEDRDRHCGPWSSRRGVLYPIPDAGCLLSNG